MKKLMILAVLCSAFFAASATDFVMIDLNFYQPDGVITVEGGLPDGVTMPPKIRFNNPKLKGHAFRLNVNLDKTRSIEVKLKVGGAGRIDPSVSCRTVPERKGWEIECTEFEFCGEASDIVPLTFKKWTSLGNTPPFVFEDGDTITVKAKFKVVK